MIATCEEQARAKVTLAGGKNDQRYRVVGVFRTRSLVVLARLHLSETRLFIIYRYIRACKQLFNGMVLALPGSH